ncbi:hypothetical protein JRO89_XS11G0187400 [Xanthoceras sorbifolium]|uniref:Bifunctional inhibitor/plant lipid transfer protein/seed storage helical domain-containing protein n=1 Tax=Xanthoceras sorbifolium TaxID=99658 RepID=A0ABQ8HG44_9ROSI|nr:hypothetical protein JRO89_XS11G0187400 [Xanthoceras sorbifolium]
MVSPKTMMIIGVLVLVLVLITCATSQPTMTTEEAIDCATVTALVTSCSTFITYGSPDPIPGSPCCDAMISLDLIANSTDNRQSVCKCMMSLITTYNPNATAIATLPGFCGVPLGFTIDPNTECNDISMSGN